MILLSIESLIPATSLESQLNHPHIGDNGVPQHEGNVTGNSNPGGAAGCSSTTDIDITFIRVYSNCKSTRSLGLSSSIHFIFCSLIIGSS